MKRKTKAQLINALGKERASRLLLAKTLGGIHKLHKDQLEDAFTKGWAEGNGQAELQYGPAVVALSIIIEALEDRREMLVLNGAKIGDKSAVILTARGIVARGNGLYAALELMAAEMKNFAK